MLVMRFEGVIGSPVISGIGIRRALNAPPGSLLALILLSEKKDKHFTLSYRDLICLNVIL